MNKSSTETLAGPGSGAAASVQAQLPFEMPGRAIPTTAIDRLVFGKLSKLGIQPANVCSDAVFVRRAFFDVIGTLPTAQEAREFILDRSPDKRKALVERLLARDEFVDYWAMKWGDILRLKAEFPINLWPNAVQAYYRWIHTALKQNLPYDKFARELLTASGSNFRVGQVNFYRAAQSRDPQALAQVAALTFMGMRAENWPKQRLEGMAAFFTQVGFKYTGEWKEEIVFFDTSKAPEPATRPSTSPSDVAMAATFPDGTAAVFPPGRDPREVFANWLICPKNPWFTKNIVNRVWSWLLGRGIVHEPDDVRPDNPPVNPELLTLLERELINAKYDLKQIYRLILNSTTYQLSSIPRSEHPDSEANFARYPIRRVDAEVLIDALCQITGTTEKYSSAVPEPFTFIPEEQRSIQLYDGSITSSFLEMFGRPARDTGLEGERNNKPSAAQRLHMLNSSHIQKKIEQSQKLQKLARGKSGLELANELYLTILSRFPTAAELKTAGAYSQSNSQAGGGRGANGFKGREAFVDLTWALVNSAEFLYRH